MTRKYLDMDPRFLRLLADAILKDVLRALSTSGFQRVHMHRGHLLLFIALATFIFQ